jgi:hypothetical protein
MSALLLKEYNRWASIAPIINRYSNTGNDKDIITVQRAITTYLFEKYNNLPTSIEVVQEHLKAKGIPELTSEEISIIQNPESGAGYKLTPSLEFKLDSRGTLATIRIGAYKITYTNEVMSQLRLKGSDLEIAILLIRYAQYQSGHLWSIPLEAYDYLHNKDFQVECFASPMNHYLPDYYSMFESDAKFGSIGNFFTNFLSSKMERFVINPPFSYVMIRRVCEFCVNRRNSRRTTILLYGPNWDKGGIQDSYATVMTAYPNAVAREIPEKKHCIYNYSTGGKVPAVYAAKVILVSNFDSEEWLQEIADAVVTLVSTY